MNRDDEETGERCHHCGGDELEHRAGMTCAEVLAAGQAATDEEVADEVCAAMGCHACRYCDAFDCDGECSDAGAYHPGGCTRSAHDPGRIGGRLAEHGEIPDRAATVLRLAEARRNVANGTQTADDLAVLADATRAR